MQAGIEAEVTGECLITDLLNRTPPLSWGLDRARSPPRGSTRHYTKKTKYENTYYTILQYYWHLLRHCLGFGIGLAALHAAPILFRPHLGWQKKKKGERERAQSVMQASCALAWDQGGGGDGLARSDFCCCCCCYLLLLRPPTAYYR